MASQAKEHEIIDLTEPDVIELDSEGEVVDETADVTPGTPNGTGKTGQAKKRRRKRRKKPSGANMPAQEGVEDVGSASRAQSPTLQVENLVNGSGSGSGGTGRKRSLADRLEDAPNEDRRNGKEENASGGQQRGERRRHKERAEGRERDHDREREHGGERRREQDRRSPRRDREQEKEKDRDGDGDRPRRRSRSRERDRERRKKKRDKLQAPAPESDAQLFFEDVTPAEIPGMVKPSQPVAGPSNPAVVDLTGDSQSDNALLLPAHVSVTENGEDAEAGPLTVPTPEGSDDDEDYIDYLDYDDDRRAGMVRYWELDKLDAQEAKASKPTRFVCKKCGAEGEHKTYECPVLICLTCGARDEHSTRSCPISKVCFTCGMKGHINRTCPNRGKGGANQSYQDCDRCGARSHRTNECPTLWRMYRYVEDEVRQETLRTREEKRVLPLGQGGEGYIATDEWCYNCGGSGHLGDDCTAIPHHADLPNEHSAFSLYNILSGPFSSEATAARPAKRAPRDWEAAAAFADGYGFTAPMEVGKQGKRKQRDRLERRQRELEDAEDDQDDWFGGGRSRARSGPQDNRGQGRGGGSSKPNGSGKIQFHFTGGGSSQGGGREAKRQRTGYDDLPGPSRETDSIQIRGAARKPSHSSASSRNRSRNRYDYDRDRDSQRGPRYRGGYR
ncbi:hypothetical protein OH76DRAFT_1396803 [Lentinus brumalis]|uniref:CCHC-type domain-containing protein n=1 Tax=Lentinus brumalis TaxID=2498619 RepID=A0A371DSD5_9APHY|nr:hypothetical protein OH76DRAFT_1396803 [Polyporus brumalis]